VNLRFALLLGAGCASSAEPQADRLPATATAAPKRSHVGEPLPLEKGLVLVYEATINDKRERWVTEVVDVYESGPITAYRVKGWPSDLVDGMATERTLVRSFDHYLWSEQKVASLDGAQRWFTWPLTPGQRICEEPDSRYCWEVAVEKGRYDLTYRTNPDDQTFELTPGIGLTRYIYHHHGSRLDIDAKLVERTPPR